MQIFPITRRKTIRVKVGHIQVGGGAPVVVQSMTNTDTADIAATVAQCKELADAGSELVRITVNMPESAAAVAEIVARLRDLGCTAPIIGDFHYNGHVLLTKYPDCARALDKYRINPGNVGAGARRDEQFSTICKVAVDNGKHDDLQARDFAGPALAVIIRKVKTIAPCRYSPSRGAKPLASKSATFRWAAARRWSCSR